MSDIRIKRGHDVPMTGAPAALLVDAVKPRQVSVRPAELRAFRPELVVREGDRVAVGQELFHDAARPSIRVVSPAGGRILGIRSAPDGACAEIVVDVAEREAVLEHPPRPPDEARSLTREQVAQILLETGMWPSLRRRPYSVIPDPDAVPEAVFVGASDDDPLPFDPALALEGRDEDFQLGIDLLSRLTPGRVHVCALRDRVPAVVAQARNCERHTFEGPYPAGRLEAQIHCVMPHREGQEVWYLDAQDCADVGTVVRTGVYPVARVVAVGGEGATSPRHYRTRRAVPASFLDPEASPARNRFISGGPLSGVRVEADSGLGLYDRKFSIVPRAGEPAFLGWMLPGFGKVSRFRAFASVLHPPATPHVTATLGGDLRPVVVTGIHADVCAVDILPTFLEKAIRAGDLAEAERLGIADCAECGLCTYVCPSKIEHGEIIARGIEMLLEGDA